MTSRVTEETKVSELQEELMKAQTEAAATKEELNSCCERLEKLQELLQVQPHSKDYIICCQYLVKYFYFLLRKISL